MVLPVLTKRLYRLLDASILFPHREDRQDAYETLVKDLPEDQKEGVIAQIARSTRRAVARSQGQQQAKAGAVDV